MQEAHKFKVAKARRDREKTLSEGSKQALKVMREEQDDSQTSDVTSVEVEPKDIPAAEDQVLSSSFPTFSTCCLHGFQSSLAAPLIILSTEMYTMLS